MALGTLGAVLFYRGDFRGSIDRFATCLSSLDPNCEHKYSGLLGGYIAALSKGTEADARHGLKLCSDLRKKLKDRHKMQRAKLWWIEGLLHKKLGNTEDAWWAMDVARRSLIAMKTAPEVAAVVAEMAEVANQVMAVRHISLEAAKVIRGKHPLGPPLRTLIRASSESLSQAAAALKTAAHGHASCPSL